MPQAKKQTAVIRVHRDRLVAELPFPVCRSRAGEMICKRETLVDRMKQQQVKLDPRFEQFEQALAATLDVLGEPTDSDRLAGFSVTLNYMSYQPPERRVAAAKTLMQALLKADLNVIIEGDDTMVIHEVAAAA